MPEMYNKLETELELLGEKQTLSLEVAQHIGDGMVRAISLQPTDGLVRGAQVSDTGGPITVPVGDVTKGHVFNMLGDCLNLEEGEELDVKERWGIHRKAPAFDQLESKTADVRDRHQGHRPARAVRPRAARSACSAVPAWARPC